MNTGQKMLVGMYAAFLVAAFAFYVKKQQDADKKWDSLRESFNGGIGNAVE